MKKINYERLTFITQIIIETLIITTLLIIYFKLDDLYTKYNKLDFEIHEQKERIDKLEIECRLFKQDMEDIR